MARCWSHQRWWWLLIVALAGLLRCPRAQKPSASTTSTSTPPPPASSLISEMSAAGLPPENRRVVVFLRELCDGEVNMTALLAELRRGSDTFDIGMVPRAGKYFKRELEFVLGRRDLPAGLLYSSLSFFVIRCFLFFSSRCAKLPTDDVLMARGVGSYRLRASSLKYNRVKQCNLEGSKIVTF